MPDIVVPDEGEIYLLDVLLREPTPDPFVLRLFCNDYHPHRESILADFTQASYSGYSPVGLSRGTWTAAVTSGGYAISTYGTAFLQFLPASGGETVYGYYVTDADETVCLWAQRLDASVEITPTTPLLLLPLLRLRSEVQPAP